MDLLFVLEGLEIEYFELLIFVGLDIEDRRVILFGLEIGDFIL